MTRKKTAALAVLACATSFLTAACGSTTRTSSEATTGASSSMAEVKTTGPIAITLTEMAINPATSSAAAGEVTLDVKNDGKMPHEVVVIKTDKKAADLGPADAEGRVSEAGSLGETGDIDAGASKTLTLKLDKGHYALICNMPGHYAGGMYADLTVS